MRGGSLAGDIVVADIALKDFFDLVDRDDWDTLPRDYDRRLLSIVMLAEVLIIDESSLGVVTQLCHRRSGSRTEPEVSRCSDNEYDEPINYLTSGR